MVIHAVDYSRKDGVFATSELNFFLGKNFLVTYHDGPAPQRVADRGTRRQSHHAHRPRPRPGRAHAAGLDRGQLQAGAGRAFAGNRRAGAAGVAASDHPDPQQDSPGQEGGAAPAPDHRAATRGAGPLRPRRVQAHPRPPRPLLPRRLRRPVPHLRTGAELRRFAHRHPAGLFEHVLQPHRRSGQAADADHRHHHAADDGRHLVRHEFQAHARAGLEIRLLRRPRAHRCVHRSPPTGISRRRNGSDEVAAVATTA